MSKRAKNYDCKCVVCGVEFKGAHSADRSCSPSCRSKLKEMGAKESGRRGAQNVKFASQNPDYARSYRLNRFFGLSLEQYSVLLKDQGGGCGICGKTPDQEGKSLAVDHDHKTGEIFGLLCYRCNHRVVGKLRDPEIFEGAAKYLRNGTGLFVPETFKKKRSRSIRRNKNNDKAS